MTSFGELMIPNLKRNTEPRKFTILWLYRVRKKRENAFINFNLFFGKTKLILLIFIRVINEMFGGLQSYAKIFENGGLVQTFLRKVLSNDTKF